MSAAIFFETDQNIHNGEFAARKTENLGLTRTDELALMLYKEASPPTHLRVVDEITPAEKESRSPLEKLQGKALELGIFSSDSLPASKTELIVDCMAYIGIDEHFRSIVTEYGNPEDKYLVSLVHSAIRRKKSTTEEGLEAIINEINSKLATDTTDTAIIRMRQNLRDNKNEMIEDFNEAIRDYKNDHTPEQILGNTAISGTIVNRAS